MHPAIRRIAIAVRNIDKARRLFESVFDATFSPLVNPTGPEVRSLEWQRAGDEPVIELVQAVDDEGAVARFIRKRGEGVHHLSFTVPDLDAAIARITRAGGRVVRTVSYYRSAKGATLREAFVHPKDAHGTLLHFVEEA